MWALSYATVKIKEIQTNSRDVYNITWLQSTGIYVEQRHL